MIISVEEVGELTPLTSKWDHPPRHFCLGDKPWYNENTPKFTLRCWASLSADFLKHYYFFGGGGKIFGEPIYVNMCFFFRTKRRDCCGDLFGVWGEAPEVPSKKLEHGLTCWVLGLLGILCKIVSSNQQLSSIFIAQRFVVRITPSFLVPPNLRVSIHIWDENLGGPFFELGGNHHPVQREDLNQNRGSFEADSTTIGSTFGWDSRLSSSTSTFFLSWSLAPW